MPFKSEKQRRYVMAHVLKQLRDYYRENATDSKREHRILINPKYGLTYTDQAQGVHYDMMGALLDKSPTRSRWLATKIDTKGPYPAVSVTDTYAFAHSKNRKDNYRRPHGWDQASATAKEKALLEDINRRFRRIYGWNR